MLSYKINLSDTHNFSFLFYPHSLKWKKWVDFFHFNNKFYLDKYVQNIIILICIQHKNDYIPLFEIIICL